MATDVVNRQRLARIDAPRVVRLAEATLAAVRREGAKLTIAFVRDRAMRKLNKMFRGSDRTTDVLSFPARSADGTSHPSFVGIDDSEHLGDVVISADAALRQASDGGNTFSREVDELVIHGVLHLCGYDHESDSGQMNRLELRLRKKLLDAT